MAKNRGCAVTYDHFYEALNKKFRNLNKKISLTKKETDIVASYFSGIALSYLLLDTAEKLESVTIQSASEKIGEKSDFVEKAYFNNQRVEK